MFSVDEMRSCIQEWFSDALTHVEIAKTYHEILQEAEKQIELCMQNIDKDDD